jgi:hypothetical protein
MPPFVMTRERIAASLFYRKNSGFNRQYIAENDVITEIC